MLGQFYPGEAYPGDSLAVTSLLASATISVGSPAAALSPSSVPLAAVSGIAVSTDGVFAATRFQAVTSMAVSVSSASLLTGARFAVAASLAFAVQASFSPPMAAVSRFVLSTRARLLPGPRDTLVAISLNGVDVRNKTRVAGLTVHDVINEQPNTCAITFDTVAPVAPQTLRVSVNGDQPVLLFNGTLDSVKTTYEGSPPVPVYPSSAIDDGTRAKRRRPFGTWTNISATTVAQYIVAVFMPGFSSVGVQAGLPPISINLDGSEGIDGAFAQIAKLIGGYFYFEDMTLYLFTTTTGMTVGVPADASITPPTFTPLRSVGASSVNPASYGYAIGSRLEWSFTYGTEVGATDLAHESAPSPTSAPFTVVVSATLGVPWVDESVVQVQHTTNVLVKWIRLWRRVNGGVWTYRSGIANNGTTGTSLLSDAAVTTGGLWDTVRPEIPAAAVRLPDDIDDTPGRFLDDPHIEATVDNSQLVTRYFGKGHAEQILADVLSGESVIPVSNAAAWFGTLGPGKAISDTQRLAYTGVQAGGGGSFVGPGTGPSVAPSLALSPGTGLGTGWYGYGYTDTTPAGESLVSPLGVIQVGAVVDPPGGGSTAARIQNSGFSWFFASWHAGDTLDICCAYLTPFGETTPGPMSNAISAGAYEYQSGYSAVLDIDAPQLPNSVDPRVTTLRIYLRINGVWTLYGDLGNGQSARYSLCQNQVLVNNGQSPKGTNTTGTNQVSVGGIAIGPGATTGRKLYRTPVQASAAAAVTAQLKLLHVFGDNTTTGPYIDSAADGTLGANAPIADASGLSNTVVGQVNAGSTTIPLAGTGPFPPSGWITLGDQTVRYTGITGNALTGVPPTGPGSLMATIAYGTVATAAPVLTGVTGIVVPILKGAPINVWVQRDDLAAQALAAARDGDGGDGVYEAPPIVDERRGEASLNALCDANLVLFSRPLITVVYACRDIKTKSGKPVVFNLTKPSIHATLTIQDVTITEIDIAPGLPPKFLVTASSVRFSLESLLQKMAANL